MWKKLTIFGMLGALGYVFHIVLGGILWKGYNQLMQPISDLTASGAPDRVLLGNILFLYGPPAIIFSFSAFMFLGKFAPKVSRIGMLLFFFMQIVSFSYRYFPEDLPGSPITFMGTMHIVVTGLIVPLTILSPLLVGIGFRRMQSFKSFGIYSIITGIMIFIAGGTTAIFFANKLPYFGLVERINIGTLQLWMFLTSLKLFRTNIAEDKSIAAMPAGPT